MNARVPLPLPSVALAVAIGLAPAALAADAWLHVRVEKTGSQAESVLINVPLSVAAKVLASIDDEHLRQGKVVLDAEDLGEVDLAAMWRAVREAPDAEFVTVRSRHENVRVAKQNGYLLVLADTAVESAAADGAGEPPRRRESVRIRVPLAVADAMFGTAATGGELDLVAAIRELERTGNGDLLTVEDGDETVRIWIDRLKDAE